MTSAETHSTLPADLAYSGTFELDSDAENAWPHVLNFSAWQHYPVVERVSGEPGVPGEILRLKKVTSTYTIGPYLARTIILDQANHRVVWKVYLDPDETNTEGLRGAVGMEGYVEFALTDIGDDRCSFYFNLIYEYVLPTSDPDEVQTFRAEWLSNRNAAWEANWQALKDLVATEARSTQ